MRLMMIYPLLKVLEHWDNAWLCTAMMVGANLMLNLATIGLTQYVMLYLVADTAATYIFFRLLLHYEYQATYWGVLFVGLSIGYFY